MTPKIDLTGKKFGRLTVLSRWVRADTGKFWWDCACDCGATKRVAGDRLRNGHTESCGCLRKEILIQRNRAGAGILRAPIKVREVKKRKGAAPKHGGAGLNHTTWTAEYRAWSSMKTRCNPNYKDRPDYPNYAGRGIKVCERWLTSFQNFLSDMGPRPSPQHSVDRINVDGDYEPSNVRWATTHEQAGNRRNSYSYRFRSDISWIGG